MTKLIPIVARLVNFADAYGWISFCAFYAVLNGLVGNSVLDSSSSSGFRGKVGYWCDDDHCLGFELGGFTLPQRNHSLAFSSDQFPILARSLLIAMWGGDMPERILVVDDNRDAADSLARLIQSFGHDAKAVYDGSQALDEISVFEPDMALVDIGMPGMDGYETVTELRTRRGQVHLIVVAVTAWSRDEDKRRAYESGFDLHVAKPMSVEKLRELLRLLDPEHEPDRSDQVG